jgi:phytoene/squalene synthetase
MTNVPASLPSPWPAARDSAPLAAAITRAASTQSYYTIRLLADRDRRADAYRAYAYFRWADDRVDDPMTAPAERTAFLNRQHSLLAAGYRGRMPGELCPEEQLLADLIAGDDEAASGLQTYLRHMMAVMACDVARRGRLISAAELAEYERLLASAVMEALLHFIGHGTDAPAGEARYAAVRGACVVHMLRDLVEDVGNGYVNVPAEYLAARGVTAIDPDDPAIRDWARQRLALARDCFREGWAYIARLPNRRLRLAGYAYVARFEYVARLIERDGYRLRAAYPERKSAASALWLAGRTLSYEVNHE